jgi:hypothetical protein
MKAKLGKLLNRIQIYLLTVLGGIKRQAFDLLGARLYEAELRTEKERALTKDLTDKVFALERIKEALLEENKKLAEGFKRIQDENKRLSDLHGRTEAVGAANMNIISAANRASEKLQREKQDLLVKLGIAEESLRDERDGHRVLNDTNRALEARLKTIMKDLFPGGHGMYIHYYDEKTLTSKPFKIPMKLQKKISALLTEKQKSKVKKVKAADGNVR